MSAIDNQTRIQHIKDASQKIIDYTQGKSKEDFVRDELLQLAIIRLIEIIGEASARLTEDFREDHTDIPWQAIIGMRNRLV
ncbi:MAG: HepT-like ribonuclease domain-containing protein, partial [Chloroflexota bacterium]